MACCRERRWLALGLALATGSSGCLSGHLLDAARRRERPVAIRAASVDGDRLLVRYTTEVTDDTGARLGAAEGAAALPLTALRTTVAPAADAVQPVWISPAQVTRGQSIGLRDGATDERAGCAAPPELEVVRRDGRDVAIAWRDDGITWAPVPTAGLTRIRTAPWAWPLVPVTLAADAVAVPVLLFFAPAVLVVGE